MISFLSEPNNAETRVTPVSRAERQKNDLETKVQNSLRAERLIAQADDLPNGMMRQKILACAIHHLAMADRLEAAHCYERLLVAEAMIRGLHP